MGVGCGETLGLLHGRVDGNPGRRSLRLACPGLRYAALSGLVIGGSGLARCERHSYFPVMTTMQVKAQIDAMSDEDCFFAAAYLEHLANTKDEVYRMTLAKRMQSMEAGQKVPLERLKVLHQALEHEKDELV